MTEATRSDVRSTLARAVLALIAISAVGFLMSVIGHIADWKGFDADGDSTIAGSTFWFLYFFGGIAALVAGVTALIRSRGGDKSERRAGLLAMAYVIGSVAVVALVDAVSG